MRTYKTILPIILVSCTSLSCGPKSPAGGGTTETNAETRAAGDNAATDAEIGTAISAQQVSLADVGLSATALDRAIDPCDDFYQYACGGWMATTEIPADRATWDRGFSEIQERNQNEIKRILTEAATDSDSSEVTAKLGAYYASCMDEEAVEQAGIAAIEPLLEQARKIRTWKQIGPTVTELHRNGIWAVFTIDIDQDFMNTSLVTTYLEQGGLGLPDRDYYLKDDDKSKHLREVYLGHVERMLALAGMDPKRASQAAKDVLKLETELARVSKTRVEMRDIQKLYNKIDRDGLTKTFKNLDWKQYFAAQGVPDLQDISVSSVRFFEGANGLFKRGTPKQWSHYLQWHIVRSMASTLPKAFVDEQFALAQALTGQKEQRPRWKRCAKATDDALPDYLSQAFIESMFPPEAKQAAESMVHGISDAFAAQVGGYDWMDDATKQRALEKREMMAYLIGYPGKWEVYDFELDPRQYAANALAARRFEWARQWKKTTRPVDRNEWLMSAPTVNAYYHPLRNHMVYPAGILQPPFFDARAALAVNMGSLGMIVGHELTHGFDDQGSQFAGSGALENWWSPEVGSKFKERTQCVVDQYDGFEALPGVKVNGKLTLGENIADLGGVKLAYRAYRKMREGAQPVIADGFTEDQQFFLAVGQAWCSKWTDEITRLIVTTDPHSPPAFRVNGSLSNLPEFAEAFQCKKGTAMNREQMCTVW